MSDHPDNNTGADVASSLPFVHFADIQVPVERERWLVESVWPRLGCGILGGDAKLGKSQVVTEFIVSVASGAPFLGLFDVADPGPVLLCSMEGQRWLASDRLRRVCARLGLEARDVPIHVLDRPSLRLDDPEDAAELDAALRRFAPKILVLDPLRRLHRVDENAAGPMSDLLGRIQVLQRTHSVAVLVVHHARKNLAKGLRPGLGLRGSTDLHAWGDCNWYLRDAGKGDVTLTIEHRSAASPPPLRLRKVHGGGVEVVEDVDPEEPGMPVAEAIISELRTSDTPIGFGELRGRLGVGAEKLSAALKDLEAEGTIEKAARNWALRSVPANGQPGTPEQNGTDTGSATASVEPLTAEPDPTPDNLRSVPDEDRVEAVRSGTEVLESSQMEGRERSVPFDAGAQSIERNAGGAEPQARPTPAPASTGGEVSEVPVPPQTQAADESLDMFFPEWRLQ